MFNLTLRLTDGSSITTDIEENSKIIDLKSAIEAAHGHKKSLIKLIFKGKILEDDRTLSDYGIQNSSVLHLVVTKVQPKINPPTNNNINTNTYQAPPIPQTNSTPNPQTQPANPFLNQFAGMPRQPQSLADMQRRAREMMVNNPGMMENMMNSPVMQSMMNNPEMMKQMITSNPELSSLIDSNPQLAQLLNDPSLMREAMNAMRNPEAMNAMLRSQDQMLANIENMPGGFNALSRAYTDVQEPLQDATSRFGQTTPTAVPETTGGMNTNPLPNPWAPSTSPSEPNNTYANPGDLPANTQPFNQFMGTARSNPDYNSLMNSPFFQQTMQYYLSHPTEMENLLSQYRDVPAPSGFPQPATNARPIFTPPVDLEVLRVRYSAQLEQLHELGFFDDDKSLRFLNMTQGNVEFAVNRMLG